MEGAGQELEMRWLPLVVRTQTAHAYKLLPAGDGGGVLVMGEVDVVKMMVKVV